MVIKRHREEEKEIRKKDGQALGRSQSMLNGDPEEGLEQRIGIAISGQGNTNA